MAKLINHGYIGTWKFKKPREYSYTFKGKTVAQIQADGFSSLTGTLQVNSNGITGSSSSDCRIKIDIPNLASAKEITISGTVVVNTSNIRMNAAAMMVGAGTGWGTGALGVALEGANYDGVSVEGKLNGTAVNGTIVGKITANGTYPAKVIIDLENKIATGIVSGFSDSTLALTDAQISEIRTFTYLCPYISLNHSAISDISIKIE